MGYYLLDNPNPYAKQYSEYRNGTLSGGVLLHTTESGQAAGAEPIARWIATQRRDYGSYHAIVDDSITIPMAPDGYTTWHCAASGYNSTTVGISFACRSVDLDPGDAWTQGAFRQAARWLVDFWTRNGWDPTEAARFIPAEDCKTRPGLTTHGDAQPWDRSDAFTRHPQRPQLEALLLSEIAAIVKPNPPDPEDDVAKQCIIRDPRNGNMWHVFANTRYRLRNQDEIDVLTFLGVPVISEGGDGLVSWLRACKDLGRPIGK